MVYPFGEPLPATTAAGAAGRVLSGENESGESEGGESPCQRAGDKVAGSGRSATESDVSDRADAGRRMGNLDGDSDDDDG